MHECYSQSMFKGLIGILIICLNGCLTTVCDKPPCKGQPLCLQYKFDGGTEQVCEPRDAGARFCYGSVRCQSGEECCLTFPKCVAIGDTQSCPIMTNSSTPQDVGSCRSNSDCDPLSFCSRDSLDGLCIEKGLCESRTGCGFCDKSKFDCRVCGCDGVTYASIQEACVAGQRIASRAACGAIGKPWRENSSQFEPIGCGSVDQCQNGQFCCPFGYCLNEDDRRCIYATGLGFLNCIKNSDCKPGNFCKRPEADPCGSIYGSCAAKPSISSCQTEQKLSCDCSGKHYTSVCEANSLGENTRYNCP
jgi:hypothetical protein